MSYCIYIYNNHYKLPDNDPYLWLKYTDKNIYGSIYIKYPVPDFYIEKQIVYIDVEFKKILDNQILAFHHTYYNDYEKYSMFENDLEITVSEKFVILLDKKNDYVLKICISDNLIILKKLSTQTIITTIDNIFELKEISYKYIGRIYTDYCYYENNYKLQPSRPIYEYDYDGYLILNHTSYITLVN